MEPPNQERPLKRARLFGSFDQSIEIIAFLLLNREQVTNTVHKEVLCSASLVLRTEYERQDAEDQKITISLPDTDLNTLKVALYWMYHKEICLPEDLFGLDSATLNGGIMDTLWELLVKVYVFAERYQIRLLRIDVIDAMIQLQTQDEPEPFETGIVFQAYKLTGTDASGRKLRDLMVLMARLYCQSDELVTNKEMLMRECLEFVWDLAIKLMDFQNSIDIDLDEANFASTFCTSHHEHDLLMNANRNGVAKCGRIKPFIKFTYKGH